MSISAKQVMNELSNLVVSRISHQGDTILSYQESRLHMYLSSANLCTTFSDKRVTFLIIFL